MRIYIFLFFDLRQTVHTRARLSLCINFRTRQHPFGELELTKSTLYWVDINRTLLDHRARRPAREISPPTYLQHQQFYFLIGQSAIQLRRGPRTRPTLSYFNRILQTVLRYQIRMFKIHNHPLFPTPELPVRSMTSCMTRVLKQPSFPSIISAYQVSRMTLLHFFPHALRLLNPLETRRNRVARSPIVSLGRANRDISWIFMINVFSPQQPHIYIL